MSTCIVTGGAGFIGSNLVRELVKNKNRVIVVDNLSTGSRENLKGVDVLFANIPCSRIEEIALYRVSKPNIIFHLGIPSSSPLYRSNRRLVSSAINDFIKIMELARMSNARVVYASSSSIYRGCKKPYREDMIPRPFDFYTEARLSMERLASVYYQLYGITSIGLRLFSVYGPYELAKGRFANVITQMLLNEEFTIYGDGSQTRDFTYITDVVRAFILASEIDLEGALILNVGTGRETSFREIAEIIQKIKPLRVKYSPNPIKNYVQETLADISLIKKTLDWKPEIRLENGVDMTWNWIKSTNRI